MSSVLMVMYFCTAYSSDIKYTPTCDYETQKVIYYTNTEKIVPCTLSLSCAGWQTSNYPILQTMHDLLKNKEDLANKSMQYYLELMDKLVKSTKQFTYDVSIGKYNIENTSNINKQTLPSNIVEVFAVLLNSIVKNILKMNNENSNVNSIINTFISQYKYLIVNVDYDDYLQNTTLEKQDRLNEYPKKLDEIFAPVKRLGNNY